MKYVDTTGSEIEMDAVKCESPTYINCQEGSHCADAGEYIVYLPGKFPIVFLAEAFEQSFKKVEVSL